MVALSTSRYLTEINRMVTMDVAPNYSLIAAAADGVAAAAAGSLDSKGASFSLAWPWERL